MKASSAGTPDRLTETPPDSQFCDLVLNGGVASGVVYPWAILELARHYRFKNIGGNSVGAMAAALAAAAEYGRCSGVADAFEPLRRLPLLLAEEDEHQDPQMLRLFQPDPSVQRLFDLFLAVVESSNEPDDGKESMWRKWRGRVRMLWTVLHVYRLWLPLLALALLLVLLLDVGARRGVSLDLLLPLTLLAVGGIVATTVLVLGFRLASDLRALATNGYGLCRGMGDGVKTEAFVEWLHRGIQLSAGRSRTDPPLTFADLWAAPRFGQAGPAPLPGDLQPLSPSIDLQMFTSNVTQGRPVRLPLNDANTRLYYDPAEWKAYFPEYVLKALEGASAVYKRASPSDPPSPNPDDREQTQLMQRLRELPSGGMPIVVAARLSLSFPFLFSCVPVWAVDYEMPSGKRVLRKCLFSDGGLCSNFPVHLFDAAHPRWPTFAMLLDRRLEAYQQAVETQTSQSGQSKAAKPQEVWLPLGEAEGRADNWQRYVPGAELKGDKPRGFLGLAEGLVMTMKDWNDRVTGRLPQVRNRIIRLALKPGEGQLNIAMKGKQILEMAAKYGTVAGRKLVEAYAPDDRGNLKPAWQQHVYVRSMIEMRALRRHLCNYGLAVRSAGGSVPLRDLLKEATQRKLLLGTDGKLPSASAPPELKRGDEQALERVISAVEALERELAACEKILDAYQPKLEPQFRLRPPV